MLEVYPETLGCNVANGDCAEGKEGNPGWGYYVGSHVVVGLSMLFSRKENGVTRLNMKH